MMLLTDRRRHRWASTHEQIRLYHIYIYIIYVYANTQSIHRIHKWHVHHVLLSSYLLIFSSTKWSGNLTQSTSPWWRGAPKLEVLLPALLRSQKIWIQSTGDEFCQCWTNLSENPSLVSRIVVTGGRFGDIFPILFQQLQVGFRDTSQIRS
jgi:hypothetical protein